jgi:hypothetical protein
VNVKTQSDRTPILELRRLSKPMRRSKATEAEAKAMDEEAIRIVRLMRSNWLRLGRLVQKIIDTQAFEALGFPNMQAWMNARFGESLSSAFSALRSVRALRGVPEEKLNQIGERNAHALSCLPEKVRKSDEWLDKAANLPTKEFQQEAKALIEKNAGIQGEKFKTFSVALPESVYEMMLAAEKKIARSLDMDIETRPGLRITLWEAWAQWILQTDEQTIKAQTEGLADFSSANGN